MAVVFEKSVKMGNYIAHLKIQEVRPNYSRPDGHKVNFVLVDLRTLKPVLLLDNHAPFGYHVHPDAEQNHNERIEISVSSPYEALDIFLKKAKEIARE